MTSGRLSISINGQDYIAPQEVIELLRMVSQERDYYRMIIENAYRDVTAEFPKDEYPPDQVC